MKKDIEFPEIKDVYVVIASQADGWKVYLLNRSGKRLTNIFITSKGYGMVNGESKKTSVLRHMIPDLTAGDYALIEPISEEVFPLNNEYWVSFYINKQLFDKKYIFVPETIIKEHLVLIDEIGVQGVLHS